ncbi:hypothetical protein B0H11DRAFT_2233984 [Mycena galericulata]|nr:hypothetical protein B0H11DRAFT_2233984 [Mycena galericulata]
MGNEKGPLWAFFYPHTGTNSKHNRASCRACVDYTLKHPPQEWSETEPPTDLTPEEKEAQFNRACDFVGDVGGVVSLMAAHILGYSGHSACPHTSQRAVSEANKSQAEAKARKDGGSAPPPVTGKRLHAAANDLVLRRRVLEVGSEVANETLPGSDINGVGNPIGMVYNVLSL